MGKRYYCDYCNKSMAAAPGTIRTHMKGLFHQKMVVDHYQQFKDPEKILAEEILKNPCMRFPQGQCQFGGICRFSHYTRQQIDQLRELVATTTKMKMDILQPSFEELYQKLQDQKVHTQKICDGNTVMCDKNGKTYVFPWVYNTVFHDYGENLPPSIRQFNLEDFEEASIEMWG